MAESGQTLSAREYARRSGLDWGHVRRLAAQGRIEGATRTKAGWQLPAPNPPSHREALSPRSGQIRAYTDPATGQRIEVGHMSKAQYRVWARSAPYEKIRQSERVTFELRTGSRGRKIEFRTIKGPLADRQMSASKAAEVLREQTPGSPSIGYPT